MKIWFDLSNSPHVIMFQQLIKELMRDGHDVCISARPLANTIALLEQYELEYEIIGKHYGKPLISKMMGYPVRVWELVNYVRRHKPDLAVSQSSFHSPLVARIAGIPSIYTNDNEHAFGNKIAFLFATRILVPEVFPKKNNSSKMIFYPGIKEGMYFWSRANDLMRVRTEHRTNIDTIYFRPEPSTAQYYRGAVYFMDECIRYWKDKYKIVVLTRNDEQVDYYKKKIEGILVPKKPLTLEEIASNCCLFIGAGGTMTRELAFLGIPTLSVYQGQLLQSDEWLIRQGRMYHNPKLRPEIIEKCLEDRNDLLPEDILFKKGQMAFNLFKKTILDYAG